MSESRRVPALECTSFTESLKSKSRRRREDAGRLREARMQPRPPRNDLTPALALVEIPIDDLSLPARRLRKAETAHVAEVARSIAALGFAAPILIGKNNLVLDGAIRVEAARQLRLARVPCVRIDHLDEGEQRLLRLAANRLAEKGEWNLEELKVEIEDLVLQDAPIEIAGFSLDEIDQVLLDDNVRAAEAGPLEPEASAVAVARRGDVFALGPHRLICGDATDASDWRRLMDDGVLARIFLTDQPFNVKIAGHVSGAGHREFVMASGEMSEVEFLAFNASYIEAGLAFLVDGGVFGTFIDWRGHPTVHVAATQLGLTPLNLIVWGKTNAGMGSLYRSQHELLPLFKKGAAPHVNNIELGKRGRWRSNLWAYPGASSLGSDARRGLKDHPTVKPTAMLEDALLDLTNRGDIVLDPFLGSGSTLIAAHNTGRICRGLELDPVYADVVMRRFEAVSGLEARLLETGETFAELAARRAREHHEVCGASVPDGRTTPEAAPTAARPEPSAPGA